MLEKKNNKIKIWNGGLNRNFQKFHSMFKYGIKKFINNKKKKMKGLNVFGFAEDFCGLVVCVQKIQEDRKGELKYQYRDIKLIAMDKKFYKKIYEIRLFNDQVYKNVRKGDFVVFRNSLIFKKKGKKIKLEFLRNESLLLIGDKEIQNVKGLQYWKELDRNRRIYKLDKIYKQNFVI